ncbi:hypothetical protein AB3C09_004557 [Klebsiella variicola]
MEKQYTPLRRRFLKKMALITAGCFALKNGEVNAVTENRKSAHSSDFAIFIKDLLSKKTNYIGEVISVTNYYANKDILESNISLFRSIPPKTITPDDVIYFEGANCIWGRVFDSYLNVEWFGAIGDGVTDDTNSIEAANNYAHQCELPLHFSTGKKYIVNGSFELDVAKTSWHGGDNTILHWSQAPSQFALRVFSSRSTYSHTHVNNKLALSNLTFLGGGIRNLYDAIAISLGGNEESSSLFSLKNINVQGWNVNLFFNDNSWRIKIEDSLFLWGRILSKPNAKNSGECMYFSNCMFADNFSTTELYTGDWHYNACSIDNHEIKVFGDACVYFDNGHIENPGRKNNKFVAVGIYSKDASASVTNSRLIMSKTPKLITTPVFYVADENQSLGLYVNNLRCDQNTNFDPSATDAKGVFLVGGNGKVVMDNIFINIVNSSFIALSKNINTVLVNQLFENDLNGWSISGDATVQSNVCHVSEQCLLLTNKAKIEQKVMVRGREIITGGVWVKAPNEDTIVRIMISFVDADGNLKKGKNFVFQEKGKYDWQWIRIGAIAPVDDCYCIFSFSSFALTDTTTYAYFDGLVINKANK